MQDPKAIPFSGIPERDGYVLMWVRSDEAKNINKVELDGEKTETIFWALEVTGLSRNTLTHKLDHFRDVLDVDKGGCVYFPYNSGSPWKFKAEEFIAFVQKHKKEFMKAKR